MSDKHSPVSPSGCERFWNCPGSVRLSKGKKKGTSKYAQEGTNAHFLAETVLRTPKSQAIDYLDSYLGTLDDEFLVTEDMANAVQVYVDKIDSDLAKYGLNRSNLNLEFKFNLTIDEEARGSCDCWFVSPCGCVYVYDYKHGAGKMVDAIENKQLMYYACGIAEVSLYEQFNLCIVQPRTRDSESVKEFVISGEGLRTWLIELEKRIDATREPNAPVVSGDWCKWCPADTSCPAFTKGMQECLPKVTNTDIVLPNPLNVPVEQISSLLIKAFEFEDLYSQWKASLVDIATVEALKGTTIEGFEVETKLGNRKWKDEKEVIKILGEAAYEQKIKSPAKCSKLITKEVMEDLVTREEKAPTLKRVEAKKKIINRFKEV